MGLYNIFQRSGTINIDIEKAKVKNIEIFR